MNGTYNELLDMLILVGILVAFAVVVAVMLMALIELFLKFNNRNEITTTDKDGNIVLKKEYSDNGKDKEGGEQ